MKKLVSFLIAVVLSTSLMAQAPQAFAFQSSISDTLGNPLSNQGISVRFDIHTGSAAGSVVYAETQSVITSASGYFSANVGQGATVSGTFTGINWGTSTYWLEVLVDTLGGTNYVSLGASQLLSVPYALSAGNSTPSTYFYGELTGLYMGASDTMVFIASFNRNSGYDQATGIFTVPAAGLYEITIDPSGNTGLLDLYLNNNPVLSVASYPKTYTMELSSGDTIYLMASEYWSPKLKIVEIK